MKIGKKILAISTGLVALSLAACSTPAASVDAPPSTEPATPSVSPSTDWDALNQEEINDPAPLADSTIGPYGYERVTIGEVSYSVIEVTERMTVDLVLDGSGKKDGTYGTSRGGNFHKVTVGVENESPDTSQDEYDQPLLWQLSSGPRVCLETKGNVLGSE